MFRRILWVLGAGLLLISGALAQPLALEPVQSGMSALVFVTNAGDGSGRLFLVEQAGRIRVLRDGALLPMPFLDLSGSVTCCGERGLLGLAFEPDYKTTGRFYVNYTTTVAGQLTSRIARFTTEPANADRVNTGTEEILLTYDQPASNHNGGWLGFGPDGMLYIATGDGGSGGDPWSASGNAQDRSVLLGKMLRIGVIGVPDYEIPADNPFAGTVGMRGEIWAYGLRNPWRNSFDRMTGDLYLGDVGQGDIEEVDFQPASSIGGENYGWRVMEGNSCYDPGQQGGNPPCNDAAFTDPIHTYDHSGQRRAVTGGYVYRGEAMPRSHGLYFFADYNSHEVISLHYINGVGVTEFQDRTAELDPGLPITSFGEDERGELYLVSPTSVSRIVDTTAASARTAVLPDFAAAAGPDHVATLAELQGAGVAISQQEYDELDADGNAQLSLAELLNVTGVGSIHHADTNLDGAIGLAELLRVIQLYNALHYSCASSTEDGFQAGPSGGMDCTRHSADYQRPQGVIGLSELLRVIQFYNTGGLAWCPGSNSEDGFCPVAR